MTGPINIRPSSELRSNYGDITSLAKESGAPVFLTQNGAGDTVLMDMDTFTQRENMLDRREAEIAEVEKTLRRKLKFLAGDQGASVEDSRRRALEALKKGAQDAAENERGNG